VVLILMQLGFFRAVVHTASIAYQPLDFDVVITSANYRQLLKPGSFDRVRLNVAAALPEVVETSNVLLAMQLYRNPVDTTVRAILVMGLDPQKNDFTDITEEQRTAIIPNDRALFDQLSRPEFGDRYPGLKAEVGGRKLEFVGLFTMGTGFGADGTVVINQSTFRSIAPHFPPNDVTLGLIRLRPGSDADAVARTLQTMLPPDVLVRSRRQFLADEQNYWVVKTSVGVIFGLGVVVALLVGTAIVYQVLSADVAKRMPEFATLKAMGYSRGYLTRIVLMQALTIGIVGFLPGWLLSLLLYDITRRQAHLWLEMGYVLPLVTLFLSATMCCISGLAALMKVHRVDPADLFG